MGKKSKKHEEYYNVEYIVDVRHTENGDEYLCKWEGYPESDNSWVPEDALSGPALIDDYYLRKNLARPSAKKSAQKKRQAEDDSTEQPAKTPKTATKTPKTPKSPKSPKSPKYDGPVVVNKLAAGDVSSIISAARCDTGLAFQVKLKNGKLIYCTNTALHDSHPLKLIKFYEKRLQLDD
eukprot:TRINITY_DN5305_c0_g1_i2.p1 TRINITY_DN5305_c0_g1~~TRINITY_DN5305_c0_g1_i2.p1  ORF type:complete len:179 (+),score=17.94 TRINITY_DN5305_c0_g1_i2:94-630(+)